MGEKTLGVLEGAAVVMGTCIGAGILALPVASFDLGLPLALLLLVGLGALNLFSALLLVEVQLRAGEAEHLPGLAEKYLGKPAGVLMTAAATFSIYGAIISYTIAGGMTISSLTGGLVPAFAGSIAYAVLGALVVWKGMGALVSEEKTLFSMMLALIAVILIIALPFADPARSLSSSLASFPLAFGVLFFAYGAHQIIPTIGNSMRGDAKGFARAVAIGFAAPMAVYILWTGVMIAAVPGDLLLSARDAGETATIALGKVAGPGAVVAGSIFALLATFTSFTGVGFSLADALQDAGRKLAGKSVPRWTAFGAAIVPPVLFALFNPGAFIDVLELSGFYGVTLMVGILPPLIYLSAVRRGGERPGFAVPFGAPAAVLVLGICSIMLAWKTWMLVTGWLT